jgi:D-glycero-alpha-D-manno-heptose-7-phosphate kinase
MIISRTPFRISFLGGGSDIPDFFLEEGGQVLSTTINKFCYVTTRNLPRFFQHTIRLAYSQLEHCNAPEDIQHPLVRVALQDFGRNNIEIHYDADLPGNSGLGSSSAFGVGLATCLAAMDGVLESKRRLAERVIRWERHVLREAGGYQDQVAAAFGGMNHIRFNRDGGFEVNAYPLTRDLRGALERRMALFYVPKPRYSQDVSVARHVLRQETRENLRHIRDSVDQGLELLRTRNLDDFGRLLHETWVRKRQFHGVSDREIDAIYERALSAGALGGKLLGAGGGGFMLIWCREDNRDDVIRALADLLSVDFEFEGDGSRIIYLNLD